MSSRITIVVEGQSDAILLRKLLPDTLARVSRFFAGGGRAALATVARNVLTDEGGPLLIVMDADTLDHSQADLNGSMVRATLRRFSAAEGIDVFAFVPEQEIVFFEAPFVLQRRFGKDRVPQHLLDRGFLAPKETLGMLLRGYENKREVWFRQLTEEDEIELRSGTQAAQFVTSVQTLLEFGGSA